MSPALSSTKRKPESIHINSKVRGQKSEAKIKAILVRWKRTKPVGKEFYFSEIYKQWWCKKRHPIKKNVDSFSNYSII